MISGQSFLPYPHSEFEEAFRHHNATNVHRLPPREFMAGWFSERYHDAAERARKFEIFAAICDYLADFRESLVAGGVVTVGPETVGDIIPGSLTVILLKHYIVELTTPKPEQVIAACRKRLHDHHQRA